MRNSEGDVVLQTRSETERACGSVLILVLWVIFALAALTVAISSHVSAVMSVSERLWNIMAARTLAEAGANQAAALVMSQTNGWDGAGEDCWNCNKELLENVTLEQGAFSVGYVTVDASGNATTNIGVVGENGRINLNKLGDEKVRNTLAHLISDLGGGSLENARTVITNMLAYVGGGEASDVNNNAGGEDRLTGGAKGGYSTRTSAKTISVGGGSERKHGGRQFDLKEPFMNPVELQAVKGVDSELYRKLQPYITVWGDGTVNINCAEVPVLQALAEASDKRKREKAVYKDLAEKIVAYRKGGGVFESRDAVSKADGLELFGVQRMIWRAMKTSMFVKSTAFRGVATGRRNGAESVELTIEFVFDAESGRFVFWHETQ